MRTDPDGKLRVVVSDGTYAVGDVVVPPGAYTMECTSMVYTACGRVLQGWQLTELPGVFYATAESLRDESECGLAQGLPADDSPI